MSVSRGQMANRNPLFWSCLRKRSYTQNEARQAVRELAARGITLYIYRCENPDRRYHWHVTKERQS